MKYIIVIGLLVVVAVGMYVTSKSTEVLVRNEVIEKTIEVTPDWATDKDAVKAAEDVIRRKALEAELNEVEANIDVLVTRQTEIKKELSTF